MKYIFGMFNQAALREDVRGIKSFNLVPVIRIYGDIFSSQALGRSKQLTFLFRVKDHGYQPDDRHVSMNDFVETELSPHDRNRSPVPCYSSPLFISLLYRKRYPAPNNYK